jgi:hypothetical protein
MIQVEQTIDTDTTQVTAEDTIEDTWIRQKMRQEAERVPFSLPCCAIRIIPFRLAKPSAPPSPSSADTLRSALR